MSGSVIPQLLGSVIITMASVTNKGHKDASVLGPHMGAILETEGHGTIGAMIIWMACTATSDHGVKYV